jgi:pimeloyl-ACP methyl ester carboxylesterase
MTAVDYRRPGALQRAVSASALPRPATASALPRPMASALPRPHPLTAADWPAQGVFDGPAIDAYQVVGPADARPIVFIHATRLSRAMWRPQQVGLADRYRVVTLDLPGHGTLIPRSFRLERAVEQVARVIESAGDGRAVVVGLSLGGYVAMELAASHPELVAGLMLCGATSEPWAIMRRPIRIAARLVLALEAFGAPPSEGLLSPTLALVHHHGLGRRRPPVRLDGGGQALLEIVGRRFRPRLAAYPGPTLIVNGARDRLMRRHETGFLTSAQRGALLVLPNTGHLTNLEEPDTFNRIVHRFARSADW